MQKSQQKPKCPVRMADGRLFTDYRPRCDIALEFQAPMSGSYEYRQWLIKHGDDVMSYNRGEASQSSSCSPCVNRDAGTVVPEADRVVCNQTSCVRQVSATPERLPIGTGRDFSRPFTTC